MSVLQGTGKSDKMTGGTGDDVMYGQSNTDSMSGGTGQDSMMGGGGNDNMSGDDGHDTMYGSSSLSGRVDMSKFSIAEDVKGKVTFLNEDAGFKNSLGMYTINKDGTISGVKMLFANASKKGSGGDLVAGANSVEVDLKAGQKVGFFIAPNAFSQKDMDKLLADTKGSFKLVGADGKTANVNTPGELKLVHVSDKGVETIIKTEYGTSVYHHLSSLNGDKFNHVTGDKDVMAGSVKLGFEDLKNGGDKDFNDVSFSFDIGVTNTALLSKTPSGKPSTTDDDLMAGGLGNDKMFGMSGHDTMSGGDGDDKLWGGSGNDVMSGDTGQDELRSGSGNDTVDGGDGDDKLWGDTGHDVLLGGAGNDLLNGGSGNDTTVDGEGNDTVAGGSGDDRLMASAGNDAYDGGSGFDTFDMSAAKAAVKVDLNSHAAVGMGSDTLKSVEGVVGSDFNDQLMGDKRANALDGGAGDDLLRGRGGADTLTGGVGDDVFTWLAKDLIVGGVHLGVDTIADFELGHDALNLRDLLKGSAYASLSEVLKVTDSADGAMVSVKLGGSFHNLVLLDDISAADFLKDGHILT